MIKYWPRNATTECAHAPLPVRLMLGGMSYGLSVRPRQMLAVAVNRIHAKGKTRRQNRSPVSMPSCSRCIQRCLEIHSRDRVVVVKLDVVLADITFNRPSTCLDSTAASAT